MSSAVELSWPREGITRVPHRIYQDDEIYAQELQKIFRGDTWNFLCLESEVAESGQYRVSSIADMSVVVTRGNDGQIHAFENRCAHRGSLLAIAESGKVRNFVCVYHNWSYDLEGRLRGVAFKNGVKGQGGMRPEFRIEDHGPRRLRVQTFGGMVFGTLSEDVSDLEDYISPEIAARITRVLKKPPVVLGTYTQVLHNNWKLYFENVKDSYHASLLHVFFNTFRITRLTQGGGILVDSTGGNHASYTLEDTARRPDLDNANEKLRSNREGEFSLRDPSILEVQDETGDGCHIQILSVFPSFVLQAHMNSLAIRRVVPKSTTETHLVWTFLGFADDDEELRELRMKHANLVGPAGYISMEDGAVGGFVQRGIAACDTHAAVVEMGGDSTESQETRATEASVRGFWKAYRTHMGL